MLPHSNTKDFDGSSSHPISSCDQVWGRTFSEEEGDVENWIVIIICHLTFPLCIAVAHTLLTTPSFIIHYTHVHWENDLFGLGNALRERSALHRQQIVGSAVFRP